MRRRSRHSTDHSGSMAINIICCWKHLLTGLLLRQTVLEPITRFCAYFPDINECTTPLVEIIVTRVSADMLSS